MYLSSKNLDLIEGLCKGFLKSKHNVELPTNTLKQLVENISRKIFQEIDPNKTNVETFNKQVIIYVRDYVLKAVAQRPQPQPQPDIYHVPESDKTEENQDEFFQKLKELEMQRKAPIAAPENVATKPASVSTPPPPSPAPPPPPPAPITVIVPSTTVANNGIITRIHSIERNWLYNTSISSMVWSGPLPKQIDENNIRILGIMLPKICLDLSPYIILRIEGAGGQIADICVMPEGNTTSTWVKYMANEHIRKFATPWTVRILDAYGKELEELGNDGWMIEEESFQQVSTNGYRITSQVPEYFRPGDRITLQDSKSVNFHYQVTKTTMNAIELTEIQTKQSVSKTFPCYVLNQSRQWALLLESHQTSHITTKSTTH